MIENSDKNLLDFKEGKKFTFLLKKENSDSLIASIFCFLIGLILILTYAFEKERVLLILSLIFFAMIILLILIPIFSHKYGSLLQIDKNGIIIKRLLGKTRQFNWSEVNEITIRKTYSTKSIVLPIESSMQTRNTLTVKYIVYFELENGKIIRLNPDLYSWEDFHWMTIHEKYSRKLLKAFYIKKFFEEKSNEY